MRSPSADRFANLRRIEQLDPDTDFEEINRLFLEDFQTVMGVQLVTGNLFTFAIPRMSTILASTGEFTDRTGKRVVDTVLLTSAVMGHGLGPGRGRDAARRVNGMHRHYDIHPDDFVAVGSDIAIAMVDFAERFGWREVTPKEKQAVATFQGRVARVFGSRNDLPATIDEMRAYWDAYLDDQAKFTPDNKRLTDAFLNYLPSLFPRPIAPLITRVFLAQVDPRVLVACGLRRPGRLMRAVSNAILRQMGKRASSAAGGPDALVQSVYPNGWSIQDLGTHLSKHTATHHHALEDEND